MIKIIVGIFIAMLLQSNLFAQGSLHVGKPTDAVYLNAKTELIYHNTAIKNHKNLRFVGNDGTDVEVLENGRLAVLAKGAKAQILVFDGDKKIEEIDLKVRLLPRPDIALVAHFVPENVTNVVSSQKIYAQTLELDNLPKRLELSVKADEDMASACPKDALYKVKEWQIELVRNQQVVKSLVSNVSMISDANFAAFMANAEKGDKVMVKYDNVNRTTFDGTEVKVAVSNTIISFSVN